jgi:3-hydroxyisobutyrate dehydrogenase
MEQAMVGFVGLGLMGGAMAARLRDQGFPLTVYNRTRTKAAPLEKEGAAVAESPRALARDAGYICLMLKDAAATQSILEGEDGLAPALGPGKIVINFATIGIQPALRLNQEISGSGAEYLDSPVLGSIEPAASGNLIIMTGGPEQTLERARPILDALGRRVFHFGAAGRGSAVKLICNMLLARYVEAVGEVLALSRRFEVEPVGVFELIQSSALASPSWEKGPRLLQGHPPVHFPLKHMAKDLRLLDEEIDRAGLNLPVQEAVLECFLEAAQAGQGDRDYSELALRILGEFEPSAPPTRSPTR